MGPFFLQKYKAVAIATPKAMHRPVASPRPNPSQYLLLQDCGALPPPPPPCEVEVLNAGGAVFVELVARADEVVEFVNVVGQMPGDDPTGRDDVTRRDGRPDCGDTMW